MHMNIWKTLRVVSVMVVTVVVAVGFPVPVEAHTDFDYSLPTDGASVAEPLKEVTVAFTLPVTLVGNGFEVLDPQGNVLQPFAVTDDDAVFRLQFDPPLAGGEAGVRYEVTADDGHVLSGSFSFTIDAQVPTTTTAPVPTAAPTTAVVATTTEAPTATSAPKPTDDVATPTTRNTGATIAETVTVAASSDGTGGSGVYIAIAIGVALAAIAFVLVRSRTSGDS